MNAVGYDAVQSLPDDLSGFLTSMRDKAYYGVRPSGGATYLIVTIGQRPSTGYGVTINKVEDTGGRLAVTVSITTPPPGSINAAVITYPRAVVKLRQDLPFPVDVTVAEGVLYGTFADDMFAGAPRFDTAAAAAQAYATRFGFKAADTVSKAGETADVALTGRDGKPYRMHLQQVQGTWVVKSILPSRSGK